MHAHTFFSIVKGKAVPILIVAALMDQFSCSAVLGIGHDGDFSLISITSFRAVKKYLLIFISFLRNFFGVPIGKFKKISFY